MKVINICVTSFRQNCSLLICENTKHAVLIDPGGDFEKIKSAVDKHNVFIRFILLTHGHLDHCGDAVKVAEEYKVPIYGPHYFDAFLLENLEMQSKIFCLPETLSFEPDKWLEEGEKINFGNQTLDVLHCPGHTPGHIIFFNQKASMLIVGDVLFAGSIGRVDLPRGNKKDLLNSITKKIWPLDDHVIVYPGHGRCTTIGKERKSNPFIGDVRIRAHGQA